jgi:hypothetical protein
MATELANQAGYMKRELLGAGTATNQKFLRGDNKWSEVGVVSLTAPTDQTVLWYDISGS